MAQLSILEDNEAKRIAVPVPLLFLYALFTVWEMGVVFFSGTALSLDGKTPLPVDVGSVTIAIVLAYIVSAVWLVFFQRYSVITACVALGASMLSSLLLFIPLPPDIQAGLLMFQIFACVFMIGISISVAVNLFTEKTELWDVLITAVFGGILIAVIQNDLVRLPFRAFQIFTTVALALLLYFYFKLPTNIWPRYVSKREPLPCPKSFSAGIYLLISLSCILALFGSAVAETVPHGVSVLYLSGGVFSLLVFLIWKLLRVSPLRCAAPLVGLSALGFVLAAVSKSGTLTLLSCVLLGGGMVVCGLSSFFGLVLAKRYPSKLIAPAIVAIGLVTVLLHSALLDICRENLPLLYVIYAVASVAFAFIYVLFEPALLWSVRRREEPESASDGDTREEPQPAAAPAIEPNLEAALRSNAFDILSGQEYRVADLILKGYSGVEIAGILNITENTMSGYRKTLYSKLQIHSKRELYELARRASQKQ